MPEEYLNATTTFVVSLNEKPEILENTFIQAGLILLYSFIFLVGFFGNLAIILVVWFQWENRSVSKFCLVNMAVANFSVSIYCVLDNLTLYLVDTWTFGELTCKMYHFIRNVCHAASILMAVLISIERYVVLRHALRSRLILTTRTLLPTVFGVWLLSACISIPHFLFSGLIRIQQKENGGFDDACVPISSMYNSAIAEAVDFLLMYLIPLVVMSVLYLRIGLFLRQSAGLRRELGTGCSPRTGSRIFKNVARPHLIQKKRQLTDMKGCSELRQYVAGRFVGNTRSSTSTGTSSTIQSKHVMTIHMDAANALHRYNRLQLSRVRCKERQRVVRMFIFTVVSFAILNLPYHLCKLCLHYSPSFDMASDANNLPLTSALMYANCALNPILYAFMSKNFRAILRDFFCRSRQNISAI